MPTEGLMRLCAAKTIEEGRFALADVYKLTHQKVYRIAFYWLGDHHDALDVTSEVYVKLWNRWLEAHRAGETPVMKLPYVYLIATNTSIDRYRTRSVRRKYSVNLDNITLDNLPGGMEEKDMRRALEALYDAVSCLGNKHKRVLSYYLSNIPAEVGASLMMMSVATYYRALTNARSELARHFQKHEISSDKALVVFESIGSESAIPAEGFMPPSDDGK